MCCFLQDGAGWKQEPALLFIVIQNNAVCREGVQVATAGRSQVFCPSGVEISGGSNAWKFARTLIRYAVTGSEY